ncbi:ABC transporter permease [Hyphomicrobium sp. CS1BSMeth3]|uniref:ABC transporter permease n=1 Tax=Hyphomicrobium sp. CS1BSMeth3 TaxID=1892844 RepID=UPI0009FA9D66|nr:ABC transporter permease [Hyphomicrobium sp. CS1BSMeth3]
MTTVSVDEKSLPAADKNHSGLAFRIEPVVSVALAAALVGFLEYATRAGWISDIVLPRPSRVAWVLVDGFSTGFFQQHIISTLSSLALGFVCAFLAAVVVASVLTSSQFLERVFLPFIVAFQSLPKVAIAPLIVLWLGFGDLSKVTIVAIVCFFPIMVNTMQGLRVRDRDHYDLFRSLGAKPHQMFFRMRLPHAVPFISAGAQIGVIFALIGAVVAEFLGANSGLGFALIQAKAQFDVPGVYACLVLLMAVGLLLHFITSLVERRISFWLHDQSRIQI